MLSIALGILIWVPAVVGWGLPAVYLKRKTRPEAHQVPLDIGEPLVGLALLSSLTILVNFWVKVDELEVIALVIGWGLFYFRVRRFGIQPVLWRDIALALILLFTVSTYFSGPLKQYDSGLYHVQATMWTNQFPSPLGLANLHGRLGFNSSWLSLAAIVDLPFVTRWQANYFLLPALMSFLWGWAVIRSTINVLVIKNTTLASIFMLCTIVVVNSRTISGNSPSLSTDLPVMLLHIFLVYLILLACQSGEDFVYWAVISSVIILFLVTIKFSTAPLLALLPLQIIAVVRNYGWQIKKILLWMTIILTIMLVPWITRGIIYSGCLAYPISNTCIPSLAWTVPASQAENEAAWIKSWAREPRVAPSDVLNDWNWLHGWSVKFFHEGDIKIVGVLTLVGILLLLTGKSMSLKQLQNQPLALWILILINIIGIIYWFFTAPDLRFGAHYFWAVALLLLAIGIYKWSNYRFSHRSFQNVFSFLVVIVVLIVLSLPTYRLALRAVRLLKDSTLLLVPPPISVLESETLYTTDGKAVNRPLLGDQCWATPVPCTPYFNSGLRIDQSSNGMYRAFYSAANSPVGASDPASLILKETNEP